MSRADESPPGWTMVELCQVMARLLAPDGCPWDREQTLGSLRPFLLEETYELLEALDHADVDAHREELGDVLFQIVFQAALRQAEGAFSFDDVAHGIIDKLRRRHPHVFGDTKLESSAQVLRQWGELKEKEKEKPASSERPRSALDGVPRALPALARAQKLTERAADVGFDWADASGPRAKVDEELAELDRALAGEDRTRANAELGDVLLSVVNLARKHGIDAESALRGASDVFFRRFSAVEDRLRERGLTPRQSTLSEMDALWNEVKSTPTMTEK